MFECKGHCVVSKVAKTYELNFRCLVIHGEHLLDVNGVNDKESVSVGMHSNERESVERREGDMVQTYKN